MSNTVAGDVMAHTAGGTRRSVHRLFYVAEDGIDEADGRIELTTETGFVAFDSGPDGESLVVTSEPWTDPFEGLENEPGNPEWLARYGRWSKLEVTGRADYLPHIGRPITAVRLHQIGAR